MTSRPSRNGHSLLELLVALALTGLVGSAVMGLLQAHVRLAGHTSARAQRSETQRIAAQVLNSETRWLQLRDLRALSSDSLALRAIRGSGAVCQVNEDGSVWLSVQTMRAPDADKDSVLVLRDSIQEFVARVLLAEPLETGCSAAPKHFRLRISAPLVVGDVVLIFEAGAYHLSERALRYRLGREGRQPLTSESLDNSLSFFAASPEGGNAWIGSRSAALGYDVLRVRLPFLNHQP